MKALFTSEQRPDGSSYQIRAIFRAYDSYTESIEDRSRLLNSSSSYPVEGVSDPKEFARCLKKWATDIDYPETLIGHMDKYNLYVYDTMTLAGFITARLWNIHSFDRLRLVVT